MESADIVVIGGGPGGYVCAIRASQLGLRTFLVEKDRMGGECLQCGCIPSKSLISVAKLFDKMKDGSKFGIKASSVEIDFEVLQTWKSNVIKTLETGTESLCRSNKVAIIKGEAEIVDGNHLVVHTNAGDQELTTKNIVIATGSQPVALLGLEFDGELIIGSREALALRALPKTLMVVGAGYIGLELSMMYQRFGTKIFLVEVADQLLPGTELDLVRVAQKNLEKRGAEIHLKSRVVSVEKSDKSVRALVDTPEGKITIEADKILVSVGRKPVTAKLNLEKLGVKTDARGYIITDVQMKTNIPGIYAIGDVRGQPLLAHKASKEGIVAAEVIAGRPSAADWKGVPWAIFTDPEIAGVGLTERAATEAGMQVKRSRFSFAALGRALAAGEPEGFVRIVSDAKTGLVLGVQIVGADASNLISEAALAIEMGATVEDIALTVHPHPTLPEAIMEAAESAAGRPIHQVKL